MHHAADASVDPSSSVRQIILVGNPNVGKSVLFGRLTGRYVTVSNYPGTTVEVLRGRATVGGEPFVVVDTPGANSLVPSSGDEQVTRDILLEATERGRDRVLQVADAKNLSRALHLTVQLGELGIPTTLALNLWDEARNRRIRIDAAELSRTLEVPVVPTVATEGFGLDELPGSIRGAAVPRVSVAYEPRIEEAVARVTTLLPEHLPSRRGLALMILSEDRSLMPWMRRHMSEEAIEEVEVIVRGLYGARTGPAISIRRSRRMHIAKLVESVMTREKAAAAGPWDRVSAWTIHPVWGFPILALVLFLLYEFVGVLGAGLAVDYLETSIFGGVEQEGAFLLDRPGDGTACDFLAYGEGEILRLRIEVPPVAPPDSIPIQVRLESTELHPDGSEGSTAPIEGADLRFRGWPAGGEWGAVIEVAPGRYRVDYRPLLAVEHVEATAEVWTGYVNPAVVYLLHRNIPSRFVFDLLAGEYGILTMALTYALALILPIVTTFFLFFGLLEDTGYLPRLSIMTNRVFQRIGLNGKAVLPMVLGLGCDTMATLTTRILETPRERVIVTLLLTLGVPCSAQLGVILAMLAALSVWALLLWAAIVLGVLLLVGYLASKVLPGRDADFLLEVPPLRVPQLRNILLKTAARLEWYLREAVPLFILGTVVLFGLDRLGLMVRLESLFSPLVSGWLGLPEETTQAFLIGFLRRDYGAAGLFRLARLGRLDGTQVLVSLVTLTLFVPCIAQFFVTIKERGTRTAVIVTLVSFACALLVGGAVNFGLRGLGVTL